MLRARGGKILIRRGDQRRTSREGDLVAAAPGVAHGVQVVTETVLEVAAEYNTAGSARLSAMAARPNLLRRTRPARPEGAAPVRVRNGPRTSKLRNILDRLACDV